MENKHLSSLASVLFVLTLGSHCYADSVVLTPAAVEPAKHDDVKTTPSIAENSAEIEQAINKTYPAKPNTAAKAARVLLILKADGSIQSSEIYNSSGSIETDELLNKSIQDVKNFPPTDHLVSVLVVLEPKSKSVKIKSLPDIDWGTYMASIQRSIKKNWYPTKESVTEAAVARFTITKDGKMSNFRFERTTSPTIARPAQAAVEAATFPPFPPDAPDKEEISFTFDYNVWQKNNKGVEQLVKSGAGQNGKVSSATQKTDNDSGKAKPKCFYLNNEGVHALADGKYEVAIQSFEAALKENPSYRIARQNLAVALNNQGLAKKEDLPLALSLFHRSCYLDPKNETSRKNLDGIIGMMGKSPTSFEDRKALGEAAEGQSDWIGAIIEFGSACEIHDDSDLRVKLGDLYMKRKNPQRALIEFLIAKQMMDGKNTDDLDAKIVKLKEQSQKNATAIQQTSEYYLTAGNELFAKQDYLGAKAEYEKEFELAKKEGDIEQIRAIIGLHSALWRSNKQGALDLYTKYLGLAKAHQDTAAGQQYLFEYATNQEGAKNLDAAVNSYAEALKSYKEHPRLPQTMMKGFVNSYIDLLKSSGKKDVAEAETTWLAAH